MPILTTLVSCALGWLLWREIRREIRAAAQPITPAGYRWVLVPDVPESEEQRLIAELTLAAYRVIHPVTASPAQMPVQPAGSLH
jgi:hypothetical protein